MDMTDSNELDSNKVITGRIPLGGRGAGRAKKVTTWFSPATHARMGQAAQENRCTRSQVVRDAVDAHLASLTPVEMAGLEADLAVLEPLAVALTEAGMLAGPQEDDSDLIDEDPVDEAA